MSRLYYLNKERLRKSKRPDDTNLWRHVIFGPICTGTFAQVVRCHHCQASKENRHSNSSLEQLKIPSQHFETVHIEIVGTLLSVFRFCYFSTVNSYHLNFRDCNMKWMEAFPLFCISTKSVLLILNIMDLQIWGVALNCHRRRYPVRKRIICRTFKLNWF